MPAVEPSAARDFALDVVRQLRDKGFEALWAGGCVRDQLLGKTPKDYDVATNATPDEIQRAVRQKTVAIGAAFGVITVLGPRGAGQVEVATFRQDATYTDGRHPDSVSYTNAREDALRRDFTINGIFWDPVEKKVIDYVDGQRDLSDGVLRAIGDPAKRIEEDKLRMLRAVRFAATFEFEIEPRTLQAIRENAEQITAVSAERISDELRRLLQHPNRRLAAELLRATGLLTAVLPEATKWSREACDSSSAASFGHMCEMLGRLSQGAFATAWAICLRDVVAEHNDLEVARKICRRGRLSNAETETVLFCLQHEATIRDALKLSWDRVQPILAARYAADLVEYAAAVVGDNSSEADAIAFCRQRLAWPASRLNPPPLISGDDLFAAGIPKGPIYRTILQAVRDAQLLERVADFESAQALAIAEWQRIKEGYQ